MVSNEKILNFLYCFDKNYKMQGYSSIISLLDKIDSKINLLIIYSENHFSDLPNIIKFHKNLNSLKVFKFKDNHYDFPNLENNHISIATYYRLFIENYISDEYETLIYLDADTICLNNPIENIYKTINNLRSSNFVIAARTEKKQTLSHDDEVFKRLNLTGKYFNAGVLIINLKKWKEFNFTEQLLQKMNEKRAYIVHWDQDVLNAFINGKYLEMEKSLNFNSIDYQNKSESVDILHFIGSKKPWYLSGIFYPGSEIYQENYQKIKNNTYHIVHIWKKSSIKDLLIALITLKVLKLDKPIIFLKSFIKSL